ncbi:Crp/Fnr family transcriptional regulator [Empedobacter brevis]|uniref:Crp/Fnr family transcriptional regulator n=1 Tax=Empedobacter brevis TaxID=247 RepID=UPI00333E7559
MTRTETLHTLFAKLPEPNQAFEKLLEENADIITVDKNKPLIPFQSSSRTIYFVAQGSFIRNIITSRGEKKTVMFHTESFCEFFKPYDTIYFHQKTDYELIANENAVIIAIDFDRLMNDLQDNVAFLQFYIRETEKLFVTVDVFRNFQLGLTSEEYLDWLYKHYTFIFQRFPAQNIASFMGITPVWLSKLKAKYIS